MLIRAAATVVLICVGILLLSACGLPLLIPPANPLIPSEIYDLWQENADGTLTPIATGLVGGPTNDVRLDLDLLPPICLTGQKIELAGTILKSPTPTMSLQAQEPNGQRISLHATLRPQRFVYGGNIVPFQGSLTFEGGCTGTKILKVVAAEEFYAFGSWTGTAQSASQQAIQVKETLESHGKNESIHQVTATLSIKAGVCSASSSKESSVSLPPGSPHYVITFLMDNRSTITAETTADVLHPNVPRPTQFTIVGGPCNRQTFTANLRHHE